VQLVAGNRLQAKCSVLEAGVTNSRSAKTCCQWDKWALGQLAAGGLAELEDKGNSAEYGTQQMH
jgi:hypothetical protein